MIKAVFFDIDGTLYDGSRGIPNSTKMALKKLKEKGIKTVICTGRGYSETKQLKLNDFDAYILLNGQICYDEKDIILYKKPILNKDKMIEIFNSKQFPFAFADEKITYINYLTDYVKEVHKTIDCLLPEVREYTGGNIYQAFGYGKIKDYIEEQLPDFIATSWHQDGVDIVPKNSGKDEGIISYCQLLNIDLKDTMAFGDGENDIKMLKAAGIGVAMGNSKDGVKEAANYTTDRIEDDGLYKALRYYEVIDD